jgi:hypothetical protein
VPIQELSSWELYPNPCHDKLQIKGALPIAHWSIFDMRGAVLLEGFTEESSSEIPVENLINGVYFLRFQEEVRQWVKQ